MNLLKKSSAISAIVLALSSPTLLAHEPVDSVTAFEKLGALVGNWKRKDTDGSTFQIEFELTANNTVLVERWALRGRTHSLTIYHLDDETLLATHYCPQGNQPRLKMEGSVDETRINFEFLDATNLTSPDQSHQHRLSFDLTNMELIVRGEAYRKGQEIEPSELSLVRVQ